MKTRPTLLSLILLGPAVFVPPLTAQHEIGFIEKFVLTENREAVLKELIPGTEEYYYFHALHFQGAGQREKLQEILTQWQIRNPGSPLLQQLRNRQVLIDYDKDPNAAIAYLKDKLGLQFDHQQETLHAKPDLPVALDQAKIAETEYLRMALEGRDDVSGVREPRWLLENKTPLSPAQKRQLLSRLDRPDVPGLVGLIHETLGYKESRGFGEFGIHSQLVVSQLEELVKLRSDLKNSSTFVQTWLGKLRPGADVDLERNSLVREQWMESSWNFVKDLPPGFNSLRAHILYSRLVHDEKAGKRNAERFLTYLKLPRPVGYVAEKYREQQGIFAHPVDMAADFSAVTGLGSIGQDEALVRRYLLAFLKDAPNADAYAPYIDADYLNALLAEAKLTAGVGNAEKWFSLLNPAAVQALRERVDVEFEPANPEIFNVSDEVSLVVHVKNVGRITANIYEINTENYYRANTTPIGTDLNLDGLVANEKQTFDYPEAPILRVPRTFKFPQLTGRRGVWIIDFIGNGKSSRALLRKGQLHYLRRPSSAGTAVTILDEAKKSTPKAFALVGAQRFTANEQGEILIPFSNQPGPQPVILADGAGYAQMEQIDLQGEKYDLAAGFHVPLESLLSGGKARVAIRPTLTVNGAPVSLKLLDEIKLTVTAKTHEGVTSTAVKSDFMLEEDREVSHEFNVSDRLASLTFSLEGKVKSLITGQKVALSAWKSVNLNESLTTEQTSDLHLSKIGGAFFLQELGRTGEPRKERAITVTLHRPEFQKPVSVELKTDASGYVRLGELEGISVVEAKNPSGTAHRWTLPEMEADYPSTLQIPAGQAVLLPASGDAESGVSVLEVRHGAFVRDAGHPNPAGANAEEGAITQLTNEAGQVVAYRINHLAPGDYSVRIGQRLVRVRVAAGPEVNGWILGDARMLEVHPGPTLFIKSATVENDSLAIRLVGSSASARVHVLASRFLPAFDAFSDLGQAPGLVPMAGRPAFWPSLYLSGRTLGEEYRYVLERQGAQKMAGNMLPRPGLLLNPWSIRSTETAKDEAESGERFARSAGGTAAQMDAAKSDKRSSPKKEIAKLPGQPSVDFLANSGALLLNLAPDKDGVVTVKRADLGDRQFIRILAIDAQSSVQQDLSLAEAATKLRDLTLRSGLDPQGHFTRQNQTTVLANDAPFTIADAATAEYESVEHLGRVFDLFRSISKNQLLAEFSWLLDWPTLSAEKKLEYYSKYASHEVSFFLQRKDSAFFKAVIQPYLANKKDQTFMDHFLLGHDLRSFLEPWNYQLLNTFERILLSQRHPEEVAATAREIRDRFLLMPPKVEEEIALFEYSLASGGLGGGGMAKYKQAAVEEKAKADASGLSSAPADTPAEAPRGGAPSSRLGREAMPMPAASPPPPAGVAGKPLAKGRSAVSTNDDALDKMERLAEDRSLSEGEARLNRRKGLELRDLAAREGKDSQAQLYRRLDPTREWAENNYYHLLIQDQNAGLITVNGFWRDYAEWDGKGGFLSVRVAEATRNLAEMLLALGVLDLPFPSQAQEIKAEAKNGGLVLTPTQRLLLFHREIKAAQTDKNAPQLLVSQNFYRHGDRYVESAGEKIDKFVKEEFLTGVVYGCQVVVTNPTSTTHKLDLLVQIPQGAMPVLTSKTTESIPVRLEAYRTFTMDYYFYFPQAGKFAHHPVHVGKSEKVVAFAQPVAFTVVDELTKQDKASWEYVSQFGSSDEVLAFLSQNNVHGLNLQKMAWRLREAEFFRRVVELLQQRRVYDETTWRYAFQHAAVAQMRDYLRHADNFLNQCGPYLESSLLNFEPVARHLYQHLEYSPLVNARAHRLGSARTILNDRLHLQYESLLEVLAHKPAAAAAGLERYTAEDRLALCYYLLLQDRVDESMGLFGKIDPAAVLEKLQYDYMKCVLAFYQEDTRTARTLAESHAQEPVDKWREKFAEALAQLDEIDGKAPAKLKEDEREQQQNALAAVEPGFSFTVENKEVKMDWKNLKEVMVNYYPMDLEFLFSTAPFVGQDTSRFQMIRPKASERLVLPAEKANHVFALPKEFHSSNVLVEITGGGKSVARAYYANELNVQVSESFGRLQVLHAKDNRPLAKVYVKVFAEIGGQAKFYKDGYTDLRGKFDYLSLSTGEMEQASKFSILVMSDEFGAAVKEVQPPRQ